MLLPHFRSKKKNKPLKKQKNERTRIEENGVVDYSQ